MAALEKTDIANTRMVAKFPLLACVTIEGGGAFGFSLLGQLQALVEFGVVPVAFAGTSAGAIIATLHWAGYSPSEIKDKFCELADQGQITNLMGPFEADPDNQTFDFDAFAALKDRFETLLRTEVTAPDRAWCPWLRRIIRVREAGERLRPHLKNRGLFCGDALVTTLDRWLRTAPILDEQGRAVLDAKPGTVTFDGFAEATVAKPLAPLFLPVTNVTERKLELVCSIDPMYANWSIARAARASAGFPAFFRPISFGHGNEESYYVDGGVIANYPAWVFGHEFREKLYSIESGREFAIRPWLHVGLCLGAPTVRNCDPDRGRTAASFIKNFARLLGGGARHELEKQLVNMIARTVEIRQPEDETDAPESLLDFASCNRNRIEAMFKRGRKAAKDRLRGYQFDHPEATRIETLLHQLVDKALICFGETRDRTPDNSRLKLRANVFMPMANGQEEWAVAYSVNMAGDTDKNFSLPKFAGLTGMCVGLRQPLICNMAEVRRSAAQGLDTQKLFGMPKDLHLDVREDRTWLASVPVFDRYADYPTRIGADVRPFEGREYQQFAFGGDGAVIAVLNLDAALTYKDLGLAESPELHWTDVRVQSIIDIMRSVAADLSVHFSMAFGCKQEADNG